MGTAKRATPKTRATAKRSTARKSPAKKFAARKTTARKSTASKTAAGRYTKPELRERLRARILRGTRGGRAGQWSARKAQLLAHEYEAQGGGYEGRRSDAQRHLHEWTEKAATDGKTVAGSRRGRQHVANPAPARRARRPATAHS